MQLHLAVYRSRPDAGAVCRFHGPAALAVSTLGRDLRPTVGYGGYLGPRIPVHPDPRLVRSPEAGDAAARCLGNAAAMLLRGNGAVTVGTSVRQASVRAVLLEKTAQALLDASVLGEPQYLDDDEVAAFTGLPDANSRQIARAWEYYTTKHRGRSPIDAPVRGNPGEPT